MILSHRQKLSQRRCEESSRKIKDGGSNGYYTFDLTHPLEKNRKILK